MKVIIDQMEVSGTVEEMVEFIHKYNNLENTIKIPDPGFYHIVPNDSSAAEKYPWYPRKITYSNNSGDFTDLRFFKC